jgi:hypothetical protein
MNKWIVKIICSLALHHDDIKPASPKTASADEGYTYNYDWWGRAISPDAYEVVGVFTAKDLGLDLDFNSPSGLYIFITESTYVIR